MKTYNIFLASSAELLTHRKEFELRVSRINDEWAEQGVYLRVRAWENFVDAMSLTRLQDEYNKVIKQCDVFVMLFHTKVGMYTEEEFNTALGQFHKTHKPFIYTYFHTAVDTGRPLVTADAESLHAFKAKLKALGHFYTGYDNVEALQLHFTDQLTKLRANGFIEFPQQPSGPGIGGTSYSATVTSGSASAQGADAHAQVGGISVGGNSTGAITQVTLHVANQYVHAPAIAVAATAPDTTVITSYLTALARDLTGLSLGQIDTSADADRHQPFELADIYVPLNTTFLKDKDTTLAQAYGLVRRDPGPGRRAGRVPNPRGPGPDAQRETWREATALEALAHHRQLTLLGDAGSGKTTFGAHVLLSLAQAWLGDSMALQQLGSSWNHGNKLPIRVVLRKFAETLPATGGPARAGDLWAYLNSEWQASGLVSDTCAHVRRVAGEQGALFVLDGLDECGSADQRGRVAAAVQELVNTAGEQCRFVLTARPYAAPAGQGPAHGVYTLAELNDQQIEHFIKAWYAATVKRQNRPPADAESKRQELVDSYHRPDMLPLARNPLLLTLLAILHTNGRMPEDRADLYDKTVDLLMQRWNQHSGQDTALLAQLNVPDLKLSQLRGALEALAFDVHKSNVTDGLADIGQTRLMRAFEPLLQGSTDKAKLVVRYIEDRAGILIGKGESPGGGEPQFSFPHRTFQEFLAACHLASLNAFAAQGAELARAAPGHWAVALPLAARRAGWDRGSSAADALVGCQSVAEHLATHPGVQPTAQDFLCALLAGHQLQEIGLANVRGNPGPPAIAARVAGWLAASLPVHTAGEPWQAKQRAQAGEVLAALGDPRFDAAGFHLPAGGDLGFVEIPADPVFVIGTHPRDKPKVRDAIGREAEDDEINDKPTPTARFYIAQYPVTVAQYLAYLHATGQVSKQAAQQPWGQNAPASEVSWSDAKGYCKWLTQQLRAAPVLQGTSAAALVQSGLWVADLPSELEWEKAARGGATGHVFSWGDRVNPERANHSDTGLEGACTVGCFAANAYGLFDMLGNVLEWTRSKRGSYPYPTDTGECESDHTDKDDRRVVRGGSFLSSADLARCAVRVRLHTDDRSSLLGFRVVLRSSPVGLR
jgi:formylglycine-generating enzyme required for sulfatase activity